MAELNLKEIAARLDEEKRLKLKYRQPVMTDEGTEWVVRTDPLLDVAEDRKILYVDCEGQPIWVRVEEAIEVVGWSENVKAADH